MKPGYTKRKFYGKWLYKVTFLVPGVSVFRSRSASEVINICNETYDPYIQPRSLRGKVYQEKDRIIKIAQFLETLPTDTWAKRIESDILDIYTNDVELYHSTINNCGELVYRAFEPEPNSIDALEQPYNIAVKKYPHNKYHHKVYLLPHKMIHDEQVRRKYLEWVESQPNILISNAVKDWFIKTIWNWDRRYVLVEDSQTLLMLKLRNPDVIGRVYDYVLTDK